MDWFEESLDSDILVSKSDPSVMLIGGSNLPNVARLPLSLGGGVVSVVAQTQAACPCDCGLGLHKTLVLSNGIKIAKCPIGGFLWYSDFETN